MVAMAAILDSALEQFPFFFYLRPPDISYHISSQLAFEFRRSSSKQIFKMAEVVAILDF